MKRKEETPKGGEVVAMYTVEHTHSEYNVQGPRLKPISTCKEKAAHHVFLPLYFPLLLNFCLYAINNCENCFKEVTSSTTP